MKLGDLVTEYVEFKQSLGMSFESNAVLLRAFYMTFGLSYIGAKLHLTILHSKTDSAALQIADADSV